MALNSFIEVHPDSHFPIQNLPYGVFKSGPGSVQRPGVAIGEYVLDLSVIASAGLFDGPLLKNSDCFLQVWWLKINSLMAIFKLRYSPCRLVFVEHVNGIQD